MTTFSFSDRSARIGAIGALLLGVILVFLPSAEFEFLRSFDDTAYVLENKMVVDGLSTDSLWSAFTKSYAASYQPLTWLSFMLDREVFGLDPAGYHLVNIFLHATNAWLLLSLLHQATGCFWRSYLAALFFALHPQRVESVAWVTERKDVLSTLFVLLAMLLYLRWSSKRGLLNYVLICLCFVAALLTKPMAVTLPVLLLILDFWPICRWRFPTIRRPGQPWWAPLFSTDLRRLLIEKIPFGMISAAFCAITLAAANADSALMSYDRVPLLARLSNAVTCFPFYLQKTLVPLDLVPLYPHPGWSPWYLVMFSLLVVLGCSYLAIRYAGRCPYLAAGWFFFLVALLPVIGLVQAGLTLTADRFTYLPSMGLSWVLAWTFADCLRRFSKSLRCLAATALLAPYLWSTCEYLPVWENDGTLFERAAKYTEGNYVAHLNVSVWYLQRGEYEQAWPHLLALARLRPDDPARYLNIGVVLVARGDAERALQMLSKAIEMGEPSGLAHFQKGMIFKTLERADLADAEFSKAYEMAPKNMRWVETHAANLASLGRKEHALAVLDRALGSREGWYPKVRPGLEALRGEIEKGKGE